MPTFKLILAYDGTAYCGWQFQPGRVTLQETLERALAKIAGQGVRVVASGRTDAGVHALGQVVSFRADLRLAPEVLARALNAELPRDMAVVDARLAADDFHAIRSAVRKRYRYVIDDSPVRDVFALRYAWHYRERLEADTMHRAAQGLVGTHDFSSFETTGSPRESSVRSVFELSVERVAVELGAHDAASPHGCLFEPRVAPGAVAVAPGAGERPAGQPGGAGGRGVWGPIRVEIEADGFLYNMVRTIVGTLVEVGRGARGESWPAEVLAARDRRAAAQTAPPQGLFLVRVDYEPSSLHASPAARAAADPAG
jgi:tRNA pseudouridine38-40 synthase